VGALARLLLVVGLLTSHLPVCKVVAVPPRQTIPASTAHETACCCAKCKKSPATDKTPRPTPADRDAPQKPTGPANCPCPLCAPAQPALLATSDAELVSDLRAGGDLLLVSHIWPTDGYRCPLDRPPRF
jgi:hypothetical protein